MEDTVLTLIEEAPGRSTRSIGEELGVNWRHVWDVIHDEKLHTYYYTKSENSVKRARPYVVAGGSNFQHLL
jgi:hypothetical protein